MKTGAMIQGDQNIKRRLIVAKCLSIVCMLILLVIACLWGLCGDWVKFGIFLATFVVVAVKFSIALAFWNLDDKLDEIQRAMSEKSSE